MGLTISKEQLAELPVEIFEGRIAIIDNPAKVNHAITFLKKQKIIGFDTETKPTFKRGQTHKVALMQLSTMDRCFLFRLNKIGYPEALDAIICNSEIKKIGLSLRDDFAAMRKRSNHAPLNFVDLQKLAPKYDIEELSLQKIYALLFGKRISKNQRLSNWEANSLTKAQQMYAAIDAWACVRIYNYLIHTLSHEKR